MLSILYHDGIGLKRNVEKSSAYFSRAERLRANSFAKYRVGRRFVWGEGVKREPHRGAMWLSRAAGDGVLLAELELADLYHRGLGVPRDDVKAFDLYLKAANHESAYAMYSLGVLYNNGDGVEQNDKEAAKWFSLAAKAGAPYAQYTYGYDYFDGVGVKQNDVRAYAWWQISVADMFDKKMDQVESLINRMTPEQLANGVALAEYYRLRYQR